MKRSFSTIEEYQQLTEYCTTKKIKTNSDSTSQETIETENQIQNSTTQNNSNSSKIENSEKIPKGKTGVSLLKCDGNNGSTETNYPDAEITMYHSSYSKSILKWSKPPKTVLVIGKAFDSKVVPTIKIACEYLLDKGFIVVVQHSVIEKLNITHSKSLIGFSDPNQLDQAIDFAISIGGDGTLLFLNSLFKKAVPPVLCVNMGSLGFLTQFDTANITNDISTVIEGNFPILPRMRLECNLIKNNEVVQTHQVLNELLVDRGPSVFLSALDLYCNETKITTIMADGVIIATSTGSTAYSMAAGGSMMHPLVPAIILTPICPHTLSFRPVIFPDACVLRLVIPKDSRGTAWTAFDGRDRLELSKGDAVEIKMSSHPLPTITKTDDVVDWFSSLSKINWNVRSAQQPFDEHPDDFTSKL